MNRRWAPGHYWIAHKGLLVASPRLYVPSQKDEEVAYHREDLEYGSWQGPVPEIDRSYPRVVAQRSGFQPRSARELGSTLSRFRNKLTIRSCRLIEAHLSGV